MAGLFSISYMGCHPSHRLSYFSRWLLHHQPVGNDFLNDGESSFGSDVHTFGMYFKRVFSDKLDMGVSENRPSPKLGVNQNGLMLDDLGVPPFRKPPHGCVWKYAVPKSSVL